MSETQVDTRDATKNRIIEHLLEGKSKTQVARDLGISRQTVYNYLRDTDAMQIINAELEGLKSEHIDTINKWLQSEDPVLQRAALQERGKLVLKLTDKQSPDLKQNLNINIDLTKYQRSEQLHNEAIARLPPHMRQQYITNIKTIQEEWGWTQP